ncbi:MAG: acyl-CoA dehydrogenase C-terminal domain-containing protein [Alphaproteobacteria bacterium]|nr:acyl-CoA dehydrogenase C-terminal domain-containing protein [Alphaproteobacteria bacterium]
MPIYRAPIEDYRFVLFDLLDIAAQKDLPQYAELSPELVEDILKGGAQFCEEVLLPLNRTGDEEGCVFENGVVRTPTGFKEAYKAFCEAGWNRLSVPEAAGGANMPIIVTFLMSEMLFSANQAFAMYPGLTGAAYSALAATGAPWMLRAILPKMIEGEWTGTMCLTEPHCGTDLRLMKTRAVEQPDGTYRMTGTKIFISGGEHDMADNIIHMVIAKIPDESGRLADDLSTVNFFMVPKFLVDEEGRMGTRNGVSCGSIEKKMGIKASSTCVMNFDDAVAYRLGPKPAPKPADAAQGEKKSSSAGMKGMFGMMNAARLGVGIQGIGIAEVAYQNAVAYTRERMAGRALTGAKEKDKPADPIIVHPDIRRMLLQGRAFVEGARALACWVMLQMAVSRSARGEAERQDAADVAELLTPVIKAYFTDMGFETANAAMQCFGGHGYVRDHGMEQFVRDARINQVYEGANGVQALDLVGRKLAAKGGRAPFAFFGMIDGFIAQNEARKDLGPFVMPLKKGLERLKAATLWLAENGLKNPDNAGAASVDYLRMFGIVSVGWMWARMAVLAEAKLAGSTDNPAFYEAKRVAARYWMEREMPMTGALLERIESGCDTLMALDATNF